QLKAIQSENEGLKLFVEKLTKAREIVEVTLTQRDELISSQCEKTRLLEEQSEPFYERARFDALSHMFKIRESSEVVAAREPESTFKEFHVRHQDTQDVRAILRAHVSTLNKERRYHHSMTIAVEYEAMYARQAWTHFMDCIPKLRAEMRVLQGEEALKELISQCVADVLETYDTNRSNSDDSHDSRSGERRTVHTTRECTYSEFLKCQPLNFKGTEGANLVVKGTDVEIYTQRFQKLILLCSRMVPGKSDKVEKYTCRLLDIIQGSVMASKPKTLQEAIKLTRSLMDQKLVTYVVRQAEKWKIDNNSRNNHAQQPPYKRQNVARDYTARLGEKREYTRTLPLCNKCKFHHNGSCAAMCTNCKRVGHWLEIVGVLLLLTLKEPLERFRRRYVF
nr:hypothetical protein [Tanacetum cinerariifolium]